MSDDNLDQLLEELADEDGSLSRHRGIKWSELSATEFEHKRLEIFRDVKAAAKQKRVSAEVRELDEEAEARRRRNAEPRDVNVTFNK